MGSLLGQGVQLAMFGMGTVFIFLSLLIGATTVMSKLVRRYPGETDAEAAAAIAPDQTNQSSGTENPHLIVAITAAITRHRSSIP